jgi:hypothetical protein
MLDVLFEDLGEYDDIVDESTVELVIIFQQSVYKMLYIKRGVLETYKEYLYVF